MPMNKWKRLLFDFLILSAFIFMDQAAKAAAVHLLKGQAAYTLIPNILEFQYLENTGAAFGMLKNQKYFFIFIAIIFILLIAFILFTSPTNKKYNMLHLWLIFIASGAAGNMIDRIRYDYVVDFIYIKIIHFPIFNVADILVTVGTIGLILSILFKYKEKDFDFLNFKQTKYREMK